MNLGFPVQERLTQNALTVAANCVNRTRKHAASVTAYSVLRACPSIQCSTRSLHQQTTGTFESGKGLNGMGEGNYLIALASRLREIVPDRKSPTGDMSNIYQMFQWTEPLSGRNCGCQHRVIYMQAESACVRQWERELAAWSCLLPSLPCC